MRKPSNGLLITLGVILAAGLIGINTFELKKITERVGADPSVRANPFSVVERWLDAEGIPRRTERKLGQANLARTPEGVILAMASSLDLSADTNDELVRLIANGRSMVIFVDLGQNDWLNKVLLKTFLADLDIQYNSLLDEEGFMDEVLEEMPQGDGEDVPASADLPLFEDADLDRISLFKVGDGNWEPFVTVAVDSGSVTVLGEPRFMLPDNIAKPENASLAWALSGGAPGAERGLILAHGLDSAQAGGLANALRRGFWPAAVLSALALLAIFAWQVGPSFGTVRPVRELPSLGIRERFRAESAFLARNQALSTYLQAYADTIKARLRARDPDVENPAADLARISGLPEKAIHEALAGGQHCQGTKEFLRHLAVLETIMERL